MLELNQLAFDIAQRAERSTDERLTESFVDIGSILRLVSKTDNQIVFGRRGTGKTHLLKVLQSNIIKDDGICLYLDMRMLGSTGGIFSDSELPLSNRAARLLCDTLCEIHENLVKQTIKSDLIDQSIVIPLLDSFIDLATNLEIDGSVGHEVSQNQANANHNNKGFSISKSPNYTNSKNNKSETSETIKRTFSTNDNKKIHFGSIAKILKNIIEQLPKNRLWIIIDEWSEVPLILQPYLAEMLKRCFSAIPSSTIKIAAISQRSKFTDRDSELGSFGMEIGADISARLNLDDFLVLDDGNEKSLHFFKQLIFKHLKSVDENSICPVTPELLIKNLFTQQSNFVEFVRAAEGVPRDALHILGDSALKASDKLITVSNIRDAARDWFNRNKIESITGMPELVELLDWIINEVIGKRSSRGFLIDQKQTSELINQLYDARIIHLVRKGISAKNFSGKRFDLYSIDYGCYAELMHTSKKPQGLLTEAEGDKIVYLNVPSIDHRIIRNSILDLDIFNNTNKLPFFHNINELSVNSSVFESKVDEHRIPVPDSFIKKLPQNVCKINIEHSIYLASIFVSLRWRKEQGFESSRGVELTRIINTHLLSSGEKEKKANNISRVLRDKRTLDLDWLVMTEKLGEKSFSLSVNWEDCWNQYFPQSSLLF